MLFAIELYELDKIFLMNFLKIADSGNDGSGMGREDGPGGRNGGIDHVSLPDWVEGL